MRRQSQFLRKAALAGVAFSAMAASATAQDQDTKVQADARVSVNRISTILKTKVVIQDDKPAGEIVDVVYAEGGCIEYYVASYDNQMYVIPFDAAQVRSADRVVFVDLAPTQFRDVAFFTGNNWPDFFAPRYQQQVFTTFNINVRNGSRNRTPGRGGADRNDQNRDDRDGAPRNRDNTAGDKRPGTDADRNAPGRNRDDQPADRNDRPKTPADRNDGDRPAADRPDRTPMPPKPRVDADADAKADVNTKTPPKGGVNPPKAGAGAGVDADAEVKKPRQPSDSAPPAATPRTPPKPNVPANKDGKIPAPPVVPKA